MIQFRTVCFSAHLDSFCRKLNELVGGDFAFLYQTYPGLMRRQVGWEMRSLYRMEPIGEKNTADAKNCELVYDMLREFDVFEARAKKGLKTVYASERWLKPIVIGSRRVGIRFGWARGVRLPGVVRLLSPKYRRMVRRFVSLMDDPNFYVFPIGVHAVRDMVRIYRFVHGDWKAFFREPKVEIERKLGGSVVGFPRVHLWAYFVESSTLGARKEELGIGEGRVECRGGGVESRKDGKERLLKILWVGRMLDLKRVDTLIKAFKIVVGKRSAALLLVGEGPERAYLEQLAGDVKIVDSRGVESRVVESGLGWVEGKIVFHDYITNDEVRRLMREASVYVMPSNAEEGWGAAISDALSEGCPVISTFEAGSSATLLSDISLYHAGDVKTLALLISQYDGEMVKFDVSMWSGERAAMRLLETVR